MNPAEVVERKPQSVRCLQVFHFLLTGSLIVMRRVPVRIERFCRLSAWGLPIRTVETASTISAEEYRWWASLGAAWTLMSGTNRRASRGCIQKHHGRA